MTTRLSSRRDLALVAAALLLPIPLLAASGLMVPLPSAVERAVVSLLPGGEVGAGSEPSGEAGAGESGGTEQTSAGALFEGGNAPPPASGNGAAAGNGSSAGNVLPGDERMAPGGVETEPPAAAGPAGGPADPGGEAGPSESGPGGGGTSPDTGDDAVSALVSVGGGGVHVDTAGSAADIAGSAGVDVVTEEGGITLSADATNVTKDDTSGTASVTVPNPLPSTPLP